MFYSASSRKVRQLRAAPGANVFKVAMGKLRDVRVKCGQEHLPGLSGDNGSHGTVFLSAYFLTAVETPGSSLLGGRVI